MPSSHPLFGAVQSAAAVVPTGTFRLTDFWLVVWAFIKANANPQQLIDTPEERKQIEDVALAAFKATVSPHLPAVLRVAAEATVVSSLDAGLVYLASLQLAA